MVTFRQLRERKLGQWALAYLAGGWLLLQVMKLVSDSFGWPGFWVRGLIVVLAVGLPAVLVVAWYHGERGLQRVSGVEVGILTALLAIAGVGVATLGGGAEAAPAAAPLAVAADPGVPIEQASLAVLPFENMSSDPEQEYFSDGLTEELMGVLARVPGLRVAARTSAFSFKGTNVSADSVGRALRVAHLVEGSVRTAGGRVRITAQLVDAQTGLSEWSETYDRDLADVFAVQDEISRAIADELRVRVGSGPLAEAETTDPEAHALVLRAQQLRRSGGAPTVVLPQAERLLRQAIARDPAYAAAHAGLASNLAHQAYSAVIEKETGYTRARASAEEALRLDPKEAEAHYALGRIASEAGRDSEAAIQHYERSLALNPSDSGALSNYGWLLVRLGRADEAVRAAERAVAVDPLSSGSQGNLGSIYSYADQPERALGAYRAALALTPEDATTLGNLALQYAELGRMAEAVRAGERALALDPAYDFAHGAAGYAFARAGRRADAERMLARLSRIDNASPYMSATVYAGLGERDRAFLILEQAAAAGDDSVLDVGVDPVFDPFRDDPRMGRLLTRLGLPTGRG